MRFDSTAENTITIAAVIATPSLEEPAAMAHPTRSVTCLTYPISKGQPVVVGGAVLDSNSAEGSAMLFSSTRIQCGLLARGVATPVLGARPALAAG